MADSVSSAFSRRRFLRAVAVAVAPVSFLARVRATLGGEIEKEGIRDSTSAFARLAELRRQSGRRPVGERRRRVGVRVPRRGRGAVHAAALFVAEEQANGAHRAGAEVVRGQLHRQASGEVARRRPAARHLEASAVERATFISAGSRSRAPNIGTLA